MKPLLTLLGLMFLLSAASAICYKGCVCLQNITKCMHLQLNTIPQVDPDTNQLHLRYNRIKDVPPGVFSNLKHLDQLLLNDNQISMLKNGAFRGLVKLRQLHLFKNRILHIDDDAFEGLKNLQLLYLQRNRISTLNKEVFDHTPSLERLFLHSNQIKMLPPGIFDNLTKLKFVRLDFNALVCDCNLYWLLEMIEEKHKSNKPFQAPGKCKPPHGSQEVDLSSMTSNDLHCEKPSITNGPNDVEVKFGGSAVFKCQVSGNPAPDIYWMKDSSELKFYDSRYHVLRDGSLQIDDSQINDAGVFECMAKNSLGEVKSRKARIVFRDERHEQQAPDFTIYPQNKASRINEQVFLHCSASGRPHPHIVWYLNDERILQSNNLKVHRNGTVSILRMNADFVGTYTCEAKNIHGKIAAAVHVKLLEPPVISLMYGPLDYFIGSDLTLKCETRGFPTPTVTWFKDGSAVENSQTLTVDDRKIFITSLDENHFGTYTCRAENIEGFKEESVNIELEEDYVDKPEIIYKPFDMETMMGAKIELPCRARGDPQPTISWKKDGSAITTTARYRISPSGSLYITNVTAVDEGRYECSAINEIGRETASSFLTVKPEVELKPGNEFVRIAFAEATQQVDLAINNTVESLFGHRDVRPNMGELYRIVRFPTAPERQLARAAEVYERTLINIRRHIDNGKTVNVSAGFNYREILSPDHINLVAKLSGCQAHRSTSNCSNVCFHSKYRSIDGTCNNLENPTWGASSTGFRRILKPIYENGFSQPVGWNKHVKYNGFHLPSARKVSSKLITTSKITPDKRISHMVMQWGQFLDHDLDHATPSVSSQSWDGVDCKRTCDYAAPCFPIDIPEDDQRITNRRCIDFTRSSSVCGSGMTSVFFDEVQPREQINQLTAFIDGSQVYGYADNIAEDLRNLTTDDGLLRDGVTYPGRKPMLPFTSEAQQMDCRRGALETDIKCFIAGDIRANEQVGLLAMHTLWYREHNRIGIELRRLNPQWNGDTIYHEARKIVGAQMQHITYEHWLPLILGQSGMKKLNEKRSAYDPGLNPMISNVFATAALRFGHSLINPVLNRLDEDFAEIPQGHLPLHKAFFASWRVIEEGGVDPLLRGLFYTPAKLKTPAQNLNSDLTEKLFPIAHAVALDLAAINIQRSRDHAIPAYSKWRAVCNMSEVNTFEDLRHEITDPNVRAKLQELYGSVHNIDVWVGGILEDQVPGAKVGPLFQCLLIEQFHRLRSGDRFWYENSKVFTPEQLIEIKRSTLSRILCDNGDDIDTVTQNLFIIPEAQDGLIDCENIPNINLRAWADCTDCDGGFCSAETNVHTVRTRRHVEVTKQELKASFEEMKRTIRAMESRIENLERTCDIKI